jgi:hypothetical protein
MIVRSDEDGVSYENVWRKGCFLCWFAGGGGDVAIIMDVRVEFNLLREHFYARDRGEGSDGSLPTAF